MREVEANPAAKVAWEVQQAARKVRKAAKAAQQAEKADQVQPCRKRSIRRCCLQGSWSGPERFTCCCWNRPAEVLAAWG